MKFPVLNLLNVAPYKGSGYVFVFMMAFLSSGIVPQFLNIFDTDLIELTEKCEGESESEKKENKDGEKTKFLNKLLSYALYAQGEMMAHDSRFFKQEYLYSEIPTPPPERV